jgi:hypothetical protein
MGIPIVIPFRRSPQSSGVSRRPLGAATLEVCLAMLESAKERREIFLSHQVPSPE